ncbi:MAG: DNA recombination protein RmuC [Nitrospirota bacterium]
MELIILIVSIATLLVAVVILLRSGNGNGSEFADSLRKLSSELSGKIAESSAGVREGVSDRLSAGLTQMRDRVEAELKAGREEMARAGTAATEAVIKRLGEFGSGTEARISALEKKTVESLDAIREKVDQRLMEIGSQVQAKLDENIKEGFAHFEKVSEHLKKAESQLAGLSTVGISVNELNSLLKLPHLRGGFGEAALELLLSEFLPNELYELQAPIGGNRVDVLVKLPNASLPIDSKFPREQVMPLFESCDQGKLAEARKALSAVVKAQARDIAEKYIRPELGTTNMGLMFLPSETLYFEIVRDAELWGALTKLKVYPVSPNTLAVTLNGIRISYDYYEMAKGVEKTVENIRKARKHFGDFEKKFEDVGKSISKAQDAYHTASTHIVHYNSSVSRLTGENAPAEEPLE